MVIDDYPDPLWLWIARGELGVHETAGPASTARIDDYLRATHLPVSLIMDETPWCAAFVGYCLRRAGKVPTGRANARSYLAWGKPRAIPHPGCIVVMSRPGKVRAGHVGFYVGDDAEAKTIRLLGGNQNNAVCERDYPASRLLGYRWPS